MPTFQQDERQRAVSRLLEARVSYGDVVRAVSKEFGVSPRTAKRDVARVYDVWRAEGEKSKESRIEQAVRQAERWIRRLNILDRETSGFIAMTSSRRSQEIRNWETHLLRLQGVFVGRQDKADAGAPITVTLAVPMYEE